MTGLVRMKMYFGCGLLTIIAIVAIVIALGKVEMQTSYGLNIVLGCLATLSGSFANWAFGSSLAEDVTKTKEEDRSK